jgi:Outer membrane efflux protein
MKTTIRSNRAAIAIGELAALLCLTFVFTGCKKETVHSAGKVLGPTPVVGLRENVRSDSEASHLAQVRTENGPEPQRDRADNNEELVAIENREKIVALEREERLLLEEIMAAKAGSVLIAQTENIKDAEHALALAIDRYEAGTGTQMDVLNAQTALTEARGSYLDALRTYSAARATFVRAPRADLQR